MMNKKGLLLRDIMFMMILFSGVMLLMSLFVLDMGSTYGNNNMLNEYGNTSINPLGNSTLSILNTKVNTIAETSKGTEGSKSLIGSFLNLGEIVYGASTIIGVVFESPIIVGGAITTLLQNLGVPELLTGIIHGIIILLLYVLMIFVIITAALKGSKV